MSPRFYCVTSVGYTRKPLNVMEATQCYGVTEMPSMKPLLMKFMFRINVGHWILLCLLQHRVI